jgi:aminocarboxymuconate-semialdehyde decarboxylase
MTAPAARTIDVHAHYFPTAYVDLLEEIGNGEIEMRSPRAGSWPTTEADLEQRIEAMDRAGVDVQILSVAAGGPYLRDAVAATRAARTANDRYAEAVRRRPQRLAAFAVLPLPHVEPALAELARAFDELGMIGVGICTVMAGKYLGDPVFDPIYAELDRRRAVLFVHPTAGACGSPLLLQSGLAWPLGAPLEDAAAALQLLQTGFVRRFPNVRVVISHLGGMLPFVTERLDHTVERFMPGLGRPSEELKHFWYDTANGHPAALRCACDTLGVERLVLGVDYPFVRGAEYDHGNAYLDAIGLSAAEVRAIRTTNAATLLGAFASSIG